jgi:hypothetical protein
VVGEGLRDVQLAQDVVGPDKYTGEREFTCKSCCLIGRGRVGVPAPALKLPHIAFHALAAGVT